MNFQKYLLLYCLTLCFVMLISCNGRQNKQLSTTKTSAIIDTNQNPNGDWLTKQLFYIDGQLAAWVRNIFQDTKGNIWFGTNHLGVMRYDGDSLKYFSEKAGLGGGRITGILEDKIGNIWLGTYEGLSKYDGQYFTNFPLKETLNQAKNEAWSLHIDRQGIFWVGTLAGVFQFDGKQFTPFPLPKIAVKDTTTILSHNRITSILEDKNGTIWFGTDGFGICRYDGKTFTHLTQKDGLCDNNISDILEDKKGQIWIGTMFGGLSRYDGNTFTNFTKNGTIKGIEVGGLYEDKKGQIWLAAENEGVYCYDGKNFTNFNKKDGLNTNGILSILEDKEGRFWFGGWGGLFRYDGKSFISVTQKGPWAY